MKYLIIFIALMTVFGRCNNKRNSAMNLMGTEVKTHIDKYKSGKVVIYSTGSEEEEEQSRSELEEQKLKSLRAILENPRNFGPYDRLKKCRFEPNIGFILEDNTPDSLVIQFCLSCQTWKLLYKGLEFYGNYDTGFATIDPFLQGYFRSTVPKDMSTYEYRKDTEILKDLFKESFYTPLFSRRIETVCLTTPTDSTGFSYDDEGKPINAQTYNLEESEAQILIQLLSNIQMYLRPPWIRMCDEPISAMIEITNVNEEKTTLYLSPKCDQVTFEVGPERKTLPCPALIREINQLINYRHEN